MEGRPHANDAAGWEIFVGRGGRKKSVLSPASPVAAENNAVLAALPELLKSAVRYETAADAKGRRGVAFHSFVGAVEAEGGVRPVHIAVMEAESRGGNKFFYQHMRLNEVDPEAQGGLHGSQATSSLAESTIDIELLAFHVKYRDGTLVRDAE